MGHTYDRASNLFAIVPGLSGMTTSHSNLRGAAEGDDILIWAVLLGTWDIDDAADELTCRDAQYNDYSRKSV
jgi:hypothetical protein